jgi:hypothetical protein
MACNLAYGAQNSAAGLNNLAPDLHEFGATRLESHSGFVKTHYLYSAELPLVARTAAAIYVVRDPADVLVSNFHYSRRSARTNAVTRGDFDRYFEDYLRNRGDPRWIQLGLGSWEGNVRSWLNTRKPFPLLLLRYEDLVTDPSGVCRKLAAFLRLERSAEEIEQAVVNSSFARMREIEAADIRLKRVGIFYKPYLEPAIAANLRFMRSGTTGDGSRHLTPEQSDRLQAAFGRYSIGFGKSTG